MKNNLKDSRDIRTAIENIAREICREETRDCLRLYKATVTMTAAVGGTEMGVKASGGIHTYEEAMAMINAGATRIGASAGIEIVSKAE